MCACISMWLSFMETLIIDKLAMQMSTTARGVKYRARKNLGGGGEKENDLLYSEKQSAREELEIQEQDPGLHM